MAAINRLGTPERAPVQLSDVNPLITSDGDTIPVQSVLAVVSELVLELSEQDAPINHTNALGLSLIIDTCCHALQHMGGNRHD